MKSPFIIYADFERILVPENNGNQNSESRGVLCKQILKTYSF